MWGSLSDERTSLPYTVSAGSRQRNHSRVRVPGDSWPYFSVSDSRLPPPGGPGPRIYIPREQGDSVLPQALGSLFVASYDVNIFEPAPMQGRLRWTGYYRSSRIASDRAHREHSLHHLFYSCVKSPRMLRVSYRDRSSTVACGHYLATTDV
jgi:hypothetical protein